MRARKKGDGSFRKLKTGQIELTISDGYDIFGKRLRYRFYGSTESECRKKYKEFIKSGGESKRATDNYSLSEWIPVWLDTYKKNNIQRSTFEEYKYLLQKVSDHKIGKMSLSDIKPIHITDFFANLDYSQSIRKRLRFLLNALFEDAVDNDYCTKNPVTRAQISKKKAGHADIKTTMAIYTHLDEKYKKKSINKLDEYLESIS